MPPRPGDILDLSIDTLAYGGAGVARVDDFVVFVRGAAPGDRVRARVTKRKHAYAEARLLDIVAPSQYRVTPECGHHESCGGCEWQTLSYGTQLRFKERQVVESLEHLGGLTDYELESIRGMEDPWRYRNKMEFSFTEDDDGRLLLGLHKRGSWREIVEVDDCRLAPRETNRARQAVADACRALALPAYSQTAHTGLLRHVQVRRGHATGDLFLNLFVSERFPQEEELAARVAAAQPFTSFAVTVNATRADAARGVGPFMIVGPPHFHEELAGVHLRVPATAFLQTNSLMCAVLYDVARRCAQPQAARSAYDLYCGIGSLSLLIAREAAFVFGMELEQEAVAAATENARLNKTANVAFTAGDVRKQLIDPPTGRDPELEARLSGERPLPAPRAPFDPPAVVVVDPPRAGMSKKAVTRAALVGGERLAYVSCNPATLAGNGAQLATLGYRLTRVAPVDMFPHTHHIETVALFERQ